MADDLFELLQADHDHVRTLLEDLSETTENAEKTRRDGLSKLKDGLVPHMRAEEQGLYTALKQNEESKDIALEAWEEHRVAEASLNELMQTEPSDERWHAKLTVLQELIEHHIEDEESEMFDQASELFDDEQLQQMAQEFQSAKEQVKAPA